MQTDKCNGYGPCGSVSASVLSVITCMYYKCWHV